MLTFRHYFNNRIQDIRKANIAAIRKEVAYNNMSAATKKKVATLAHNAGVSIDQVKRDVHINDYAAMQLAVDPKKQGHQSAIQADYLKDHGIDIDTYEDVERLVLSDNGGSQQSKRKSLADLAASGYVKYIILDDTIEHGIIPHPDTWLGSSDEFIQKETK